MELTTEKKFSFISNALAEDTFAVVNFKGFEGISKPYEFNIMLVSELSDIDMSEVLKFPAKLTFYRDDGDDVHFNGILAEFEQLHEFQGNVFYRARLVPKLWWLTLTQHNRVILNESVPTFIENTLKDGGLTSDDFEFRVQGVYENIDYVCQYDESHFNFISRWLEREGIYYYFEQTDAGEKIIFTDTKISHTDLPLKANLIYAPPSSLDSLERSELVKSYTCRQRQLPQNVRLKEYNYERPSLEIVGEATVDANGRGIYYVYGEHFSSTEEGNRLAGIRAEEFLCHKTEYFGESTVPFMASGFTFNLESHFNATFNRKYLIEELTHEGNQTGYLISGIRSALPEIDAKIEYLNTFKAIPADVQYRPNRTATKPLISGTLHAKVDAEGSGDYAELDDQGRYKVRLPFDTDTSHGSGKASSFLRMIQPYSGPNHGFHFPLHKDTEVLLTFVNGDPDRPVIAGAVPNPETASPVTDENQTQSVIRDNYGNEIVFDATPGDEHMRLFSPHHQSGINIGKSINSYTDSDSGDFKFGNSWEVGAGTKLAATASLSAEAKLGISLGLAAGLNYNVFLGGNHDFHFGYNISKFVGKNISFSNGPVVQSTEENYIITADKSVCILGGVNGVNKVSPNNTIINLDQDFIQMTVGSKTSAQSGEPSEIFWVMVLAAIAAAGAGVMAGFAGSLGSGGPSNETADAKSARVDGAITLTVLSSITALATLVIAMYLIQKAYKGVSFDPLTKHKVNEIRSKFNLKKDGILLAHNESDNTTNASKFEMDDDGNIIVNSKSKSITLGVGKEGSEITKITLNDNYIMLESAKSEIWINKEGNICLESDETDKKGLIAIFAKDKVVIDSKSQINLQGPKTLCLGEFKHKNMTVIN